MRPVCVKCACEMRPAKNGHVIESMTKWADGRIESYQLFEGDRWECPGCHVAVVIGCGTPYSHAHEPEHRARVDSAVQSGHYTCVGVS